MLGRRRERRLFSVLPCRSRLSQCCNTTSIPRLLVITTTHSFLVDLLLLGILGLFLVLRNIRPLLETSASLCIYQKHSTQPPLPPMAAFPFHHGKARARSVQLDKAAAAEALVAKAAKARAESAPTPPAPSARSSSLPYKENQAPAGSVRHYRSMLHVDAPSLGPLKPMDYAELYAHHAPPHGTCEPSGVSCSLLS